jgi:hypothetical protein
MKWLVGVILLLWLTCAPCRAFSIPSNHGGFDRFRVTCPADDKSVRLFDPALVDNDNHEEGSTWAAVYRSNNNQPSVFIKDEFMYAMRMATSSNENIMVNASSSSSTTTATLINRPVAVARLKPSELYTNSYVLDNMRCCLKKEDTNPDSEGGSEHTEALSVAIDELILHHLQQQQQPPSFNIRTKATLVSGALVEDRGFQQVSDLCKDFATHVSSVDACLEKYADRVVSCKNTAARNRALQIVSLLGKMDKTASQSEEINQDDENEDYDPWASIKKYL